MSDPLIQIPFAGGIDESSDPRLLPPGTVVSSTNVIYDQDGQYQVRYGYTMLTNVGLSSVMRLAVFAFELVAISLAGACMSYSPTDGLWTTLDTSQPIQATHAPIANSTGTYTSWGAAVVGSYRIVGWIDATDNFPRAAVYDASTGALVTMTQLSSTVSLNMHVGAVGTVAVIVTADSGAANLRGYRLQTSTLGSWSAGTVLSDPNYASTGGIYTACFTATRVIVSYEHANAGNSLLQAVGYDSTLAIQFNQGNALTAGTNGFLGMGSHATDGEQLWVAFHANTSGYAQHAVAVLMNPASGVASASFAMGVNPGAVLAAYQFGLERLSATVQAVTISDGADTWSLQMQSSGVFSSVHVFNMSTMSAPVFIPALNTCIALWREVSLSPASTQQTYWLVDLVTSSTNRFPKLMAVLAPSIVSLTAKPTGTTQFPAVNWSLNGTSLESVAPISRTTAGRQGLELFTASVNAPGMYDTASLGKELYIGGYHYDGRLMVENGFAQQPQFSASNGGGAGSQYQYTVTYAWVDAQGNKEESAPAAVVTVTSGAPPNVNLSVTTTYISRKQYPVSGVAPPQLIYILVYRTQTLASGDTTFYLVSKEPYPTANSNALSGGAVTINDTLTDAALTDGTHPVLYTVSGELAHNTPETFTAITGHKNRIWGIGADQRTIWWSSQYVDGVVPFWNFTQQITVDDAGEPLTCLASLYDKLVVFTKTKIYVIYGDGPSAAGTGSDLQAPQRVPSMSGCIDPRSVVNTPMGIMFQSQRGLELLGPDLSVTYIGQPVSTTTATYPNCTSAAFVEANSVVRWTFAKISDAQPSGPGDNGVVVNFDIRRGRWAVHKITWSRLGAGFSAPMQASVVHPTLGYVAANNDVGANAANIYRENTAADANAWTDFGVFVPLSVTTAWIKAGDLQGWQSIRRIRLLANYYDHHDLSVNVAYDYQGATDSFSYTDATIQTFRNGSYEQVEMTPGAGRRCEAIQVTVSVNSISGFASGRGAGLIGLAFEVKPQKGGFRKIPAAART